MEHYDRIVIGLGGIGSAALYELARRGVRTLGLEQFQIAHDRGSSHGQTRIIRQAYFEHPDYVPLLRRADDLWCALQAHTGERLFDRVGLVEIGPPDGVILPGVQRSAAEHGLSVEHLTEAELRRRFPSLSMPAEMAAVFEPTAGFLHVERCVSAHVQCAVDSGATVVCGTTVRQIEQRPGGQIEVRTDTSDYIAEAIVLCPGPWAPALLPDDVPLRVVRKHLHWFEPSSEVMHVERGCPAFFYELPTGFFYGFPAINPRGVKLAEHSGGEPVDDPARVDRSLDPLDESRIHDFRRQCLPDVGPTRRGHAVCMYTLTPDEHFVVDRHPRLDRAVVATGLSGHGFKFAPVLGEILSDISLEGTTRWQIDFLRAARWHH